MYVYSAKNNMFYPEILKPDYVREGKWPDAGISVSEAVYLEFAANRPPVGKRRVAGSNGLPAWDDIPPPTQEELQHRAEREKQYRMSLATKAIAPLQDAADLDMASDEEKKALINWRKYRVLLNRVNCAIAPDIDWPEQPK